MDGRLQDQLAILEMLDARGIRPKFQDVVHLNRSGHEKMAAALLPSILNVIEPPQVASR